jgi:transcriptional regulator with XRE-family HTH domain
MRLRSRLIFDNLVETAQLSERELARRAGLGHSTVNHLMTGRRTTCSPATALAITEILGCPLSTLFVAETPADRVAVNRLSGRHKPR